MPIMNRIRNHKNQIAAASADFLFPPECCYCGRSLERKNDCLSPEENQLELCSTCSGNLPEFTNNHCLKCGATQGPHIPSRDSCIHCKRSHFHFAAAVSLHLYDEQFRKMCQFCKQDSGQRLAGYLAKQLWNCEQHKFRFWKCDLVAHVPMHWTNRIARRVHPAETIAASLANAISIPHDQRALRQIKRVPQQAKLAPSTRRENVKNIFRANRNHNFKEKNILLIDDILTTGTTASECAKVLKKAGAKQVYVAVLARGIGR